MDGSRPAAERDAGLPGHQDLGRRGERVAERYLRRTGYTVLARNWRCPEGELDLVVTDGRRVVVCEVKTRSGENFGSPAQAVDTEKVNRIRRLARRWLDDVGLGPREVRFDVLGVYWPAGARPRVEHLEGVM
jgi:putative endonuclease